MEAQPGRLAYIDAMRGMAVLSVVIFHVLLWYPGSLTDGIGQFLDFGKLGVVLFFMISGFVVPFSLEGPVPQGLRTFLARRLFRLYPAYWLSIIGAIIAGLVISQPLPPFQVAVNLTMLQALFGVPNVLPVYWTLLIELIFYAGCAGLFAFGLLGRMRVLSGMSLACLVAAFPMAWLRWRTGIALPVALPLSLSLMFSSTVWRQYFHHKSPRALRHALALLGIFLACMPLISLLAYNRNYGFGETWYRYTISYVVAVAAFLFFSFRWRIGNAVMVWLGQISYSVYLFHGIVLVLYGRFFLTRHGLPLHIAAYVLLTLAVSHAIFVLVERPCIRWGRVLTGGRRFSHRDAVI